ncbi:MAG: 3-isopropylmalate dehydratase [Caldilineaceae bacterium]
MNLHGRVWKYGDNVNTDVIFPGKYTYTLTEPKEIAKRALEDLDATFVQQVQPGDIIVAGRNWGCGSSREQAATCLVYNGVSALIAASFSRIFYRNALNNGLLAIVCPMAVAAIQPGETVTVDMVQNRIVCSAGAFAFPPLSPSVLGIVQAGGLIAYVKRKMANPAETTA